MVVEARCCQALSSRHVHAIVELSGVVLVLHCGVPGHLVPKCLAEVTRGGGEVCLCLGRTGGGAVQLWCRKTVQHPWQQDQ